MHAIFNDFLQRLDPKPVRLWSLIATFYGDSILPRGGEVWLGTTTKLCALVGIEAGAVRAAMSRLARDGFLTRRRVGRTSHYALSQSARARSEHAAGLIYRRTSLQHAAGWSIAVLQNPSPEGRARLDDLGYRPAAGALFARPSDGQGDIRHPPAGDAIFLMARGDDKALARLVYPIEAIARQYLAFVDALPVLSSHASIADPDASIVMRLALVHAFRRVALRDPHLNASALPKDWPADAAHAAFFDTYCALRPMADAWLQEHAVNARGPLPAPPAETRFAA